MTLAILATPLNDLGPLVALLRWPVSVAYLMLLAMIATYGLHRWWLVYLYNKHRKHNIRPASRFQTLPRVTVQLPMYNEGTVAERIIDATCQIDYPADRLQIQVVDDSTDESAHIAHARVKYWQQRGVDIEYRYRADRKGYKAGALAEATPHATGQFIAIFDADFIPPKNFIKRTVHHFTDPTVGMVQTRWTHLNRNDSLLTRGQAIFLDGHFVVEHTARNRSGAWINFNGTAGIWRRDTIASAGGWQHDTLTEDVDLSYRAQLAGWRFVFLPHVTCPAELPPEINAFKSQQHRWTKGSIQTAIKLLPTLLKSNAPLRVKIESFFHLTSPMVYLYITLLAALFYPAIWMNLHWIGDDAQLGVALGLIFFIMGTVSATIFYLTSQHAQKRSQLTTLLQVPILMAIGIGIALNNAIACLEAIVGHESPFIRTPKYNTTPETSTSETPARPRIIRIPSMKRSMAIFEIAMGLYMLACASLSLRIEHTIVSLPFLLLFAAGYLYVGITSMNMYLRRDTRECLIKTPVASAT